MSEGEKEESRDGVGGAALSAVVDCEHDWPAPGRGTYCFKCHSMLINPIGTYVYGKIRPATESTGDSAEHS